MLESLPGDVEKPMNQMTDEELRAFLVEVRTNRVSHQTLRAAQRVSAPVEEKKSASASFLED